MTLERTAVPREFSSPRRFTRRFRMVVGLVAFAAASGPVGCVAAFANRPAEQVAERTPRHGALAAAVAESYLAGRPLPVPVAAGVPELAGRVPVEAPGSPPARDEAEPAPIPHTWVVPLAAEVVPVPAGEQGDRTVEAHRFLVGTGEGAAFVLAVPVVETGTGAAVLGAVPAIEPFVPEAVPEGEDPPPGLEWSTVLATARPSPALRERVAEWAAAYAGDDRRQLLEITGDGRNGVAYVGLGGWSVVGEPSVGGVVTRDDGAAVAQVEVALASTADPAVTTRVAFDLLVEGAADPLPAVVAWGPPGTGLTLDAHANAHRVGAAGGGTTSTTATGEAGA